MRFAFFVMTAILALGVGIGAAQSAEESAVNSRVDEVYAALNRGDVDGYVSKFHEDAVYAIGALVRTGRADIATFESPCFANGMRIEFTHHATHLLSPTTAIVHRAQVMTSARPPAEGHAIHTLVKDGDNWFIAALQVAWATPDVNGC